MDRGLDPWIEIYPDRDPEVSILSDRIHSPLEFLRPFVERLEFLVEGCGEQQLHVFVQYWPGLLELLVLRVAFFRVVRVVAGRVDVEARASR